MKKLSRESLRRLSDVVQLGAFSPESFHIWLNAASVDDLSNLPADQRATLSHEFGHLLHYATSYLGLCDLRYWADLVDAVENPPDAGTPEARATALSRKVIAITRAKQVLLIDDEYYFEPHRDMYDDAKELNGNWSTGEVIGRMFSTGGELSDYSFWSLRFFLEDGAMQDRLEDSFQRIPMGSRSAMEHMARAIDFVGEIGTRDPKDIVKEYGQQACDPELLHYYALTHHVSQKLRPIYGPLAHRYAYFTAGQLALALSDIPFMDGGVWNKLVSYARGCREASFASAMKQPHPSFVFPLLVDAAIKCGADWDNYDVRGIERRVNKVLNYMGLPPVADLRRHGDRLHCAVVDTFSRSDCGRSLMPLLNGIKEYSDSLSWTDRIVNPLRPAMTALPVPLVFVDGGWLEGNWLGVSDSDRLARIAHRCRELCRYPVYRDIVEG